jgi:hypothetical protein
VISGINSVISVGLDDYLEQGTISAINCLLSLSCGIIGSVELFLKLSERSNIEYKTGQEFYLLYLEIDKTLSLLRKNRNIDGKSYLDDKFQEYIKLVSLSEPVTGQDAKHNFDTSILSNSTLEHTDNYEFYIKYLNKYLEHKNKYLTHEVNKEKHKEKHKEKEKEKKEKEKKEKVKEKKEKHKEKKVNKDEHVIELVNIG